MSEFLWIHTCRKQQCRRFLSFMTFVNDFLHTTSTVLQIMRRLGEHTDWLASTEKLRILELRVLRWGNYRLHELSFNWTNLMHQTHSIHSLLPTPLCPGSAWKNQMLRLLSGGVCSLHTLAYWSLYHPVHLQISLLIYHGNCPQTAMTGAGYDCCESCVKSCRDPQLC